MRDGNKFAIPHHYFWPFTFQEAATDRGGYRNIEKGGWYDVEGVRHYR